MPCHWDVCENVGKHPRTKHGVEDATTDEAKIRDWWEMWPQANIGRAFDDGEFAVDVDPRNGGAETYRALIEKHGQLPPTMAQLTGSEGNHYLLKVPPGVKLRGKLGAGIDIKKKGGYIVLAPSLHQSGRRYEWVKDAPVADAPAWMLDKLCEPEAASQASAVEDVITRPGRFGALQSLAGTMRRRGMSAEEIEIALTAVNERRCRPPLDGAKIKYIAESISQHPPVESQPEPELSLPDWVDAGPSESARPKESKSDDQAAFGPGFYGSLRELHAKETVPAEDLMVGVRRRQVTIFASVTSVGKTTIMLNHALAAAGGQAWLPLLPSAPERPLKIVFIDAESTDDELKKDTLTMLRSIGNKEIAVENFIPVVDAQIDGEALNLSNRKHFEQIKRFLKHHQPDIAIFDTISALFMLYSENDNAEVIRKVIRPLKDLAIAGNCAIWASHHIGKSGESDEAEKAYRGRGASAFGANVRGVINLTKEKVLGDGYVKLELGKSKGNKIEPVILKLDFTRRTFNLCAPREEAETEHRTNYQQVIGIFNGQPLKTKEIKEKLSGISSSSIDEILKIAVSHGDLIKPKTGVYQKPEKPTSQTSQPLIEPGKSGKLFQTTESEELNTSQLDWGKNESWEVSDDGFDPTLEALDR
jgi:hypothetical protein